MHDLDYLRFIKVAHVTGAAHGKAECANQCGHVKVMPSFLSLFVLKTSISEKSQKNFISGQEINT